MSQEEAQIIDRSRKRSALGEDYALRAATAIKKRRAQKELDRIHMKELVAKEWAVAKVQGQAEADAAETEFRWTFNYAGRFQELKPELDDMRNALPDELKEMHHDPWQQNCVNIGHDTVLCEFNVRVYYAYRTHQILRAWDHEEHMATTGFGKAEAGGDDF